MLPNPVTASGEDDAINSELYVCVVVANVD